MPVDSNALRWTSADVLSDVRRRAALPTTSTDWTDAALLREATDVLWAFAAWAIAQAGEGRFLDAFDRQPTQFVGSIYRGASTVLLPSLAIADTIENVTYVDANGVVQSRLQRIDPARESDYDTVTSTGTPSAYAVIGGALRLYPQPTTGGTIRVNFQRRHGELVADVPANVSTAVTGTDFLATITLNAPMGTLAAGECIDLIDPVYPHRVMVASVLLTGVSGVNLTTSPPPSTAVHGLIGAGKRVTRSGQTPYVSLPLEMRGCFTEKIAAQVMRAIGDAAGAQLAEAAALSEMSRVMQMLSPRTKRDRARAISPFSHMRARMRRW